VESTEREFDVVVLGAGAIGSLLGAMLSRVVRVALLCRPAHARAIRDGGLRITGLRRRSLSVCAVEEPGDILPPRVLMVTAKSFDTRKALKEAQALVGPDTLVALLQNGLGNERATEGLVSSDRLVRGVSYLGATFVRPGEIRWVGNGDTVFGCPWNRLDPWRRARVNELLAWLRAADLGARLVHRVQEEVWAKTIVNIAINPVGALTGMRNGDLAESRNARRLMRSLVDEARCVAKACGFSVPTIRKVLTVAKATARNKNSMLQDLERGRRTEIDVLNGAIVRLGQVHGIATPWNACLWTLVKAIEGKHTARK